MNFYKHRDLILLLQSPITLDKEDVSTFGIFPPLGLGYIASVFQKEGYNVEICDLLAEGFFNRQTIADGKVRLGVSDEEIAKFLKTKAPKVVGISNNFTSFERDCLALAKVVKETLPECIVVMGGAHASMCYEQILKSACVDAVVLGEGEVTFLAILNALCSSNPQSATYIKGTAWAVDGEIIFNGFSEPVASLDSLPMPAYDLMPMDKYIWQRHANFAYAMRYPIGHMITSRGCINNCIFCSTTKHFKKFRKRSVENVISEMKYLIENYGIKEFHFHDDSFMADVQRVRELCTRIISEGLDIKWQVSQGINSNRLDYDMLKLMKHSGMYRVGFPIETGSTEMLRYIRKPVNLQKVKTLIEDCNRLGIYCFGCFMIGFPHEKMEHINETIDFIMSSGLDYVKVAITQPLAGSELYEQFKRLGLLDKPARSSTYFHTQYDTVFFKAGQLNQIRKEIVHDFAQKRLKRLLSIRGLKKYILPKLKNLEELKYFLKVGLLALKGT